MKRKKAFTLLELLISLGIITTIATLGLAWIQLFHENQDKWRCQFNLRTMAVAMAQYAVDNNGILLPGMDQTRIQENCAGYVDFYWGIGALYPYIQAPAVYKCPKDFPATVTNQAIWLRFRNRPASLNLYNWKANLLRSIPATATSGTT